MADSVLLFDKVTVAFDGDPAIQEVSFAVRHGESRVILGAAGSGKTVTLKTSIGLSRPEVGRVELFGQDIATMKETRLFDLRERVGMLFQEGALFDSMTIEENVAYPLVARDSKRSPEEVHQKVSEALAFVELAHTLDKFPSELSGGMRRRVGIARANVTNPELVLYDSPTAGLDPITANNIMALIVQQRDLRQATTIIVTQRFQDGKIMAKYRFDAPMDALVPAKPDDPSSMGLRFMVMKEGHLVFEGTFEELENAQDAYISKFVLRN